MSWVQIPPEQLFFLFWEKSVVQVSCLALFFYLHTCYNSIFILVCSPNTYAYKGVFNRNIPIFLPNSAEGLHFSAFHIYTVYIIPLLYVNLLCKGIAIGNIHFRVHILFLTELHIKTKLMSLLMIFS